MSRLLKLISEQPLQYIGLLGLSSVVLILTAIAHSLASSSFQKYFGKIHPLLVVIAFSILGLILFSFLLLDGQFAVYRAGNYQGILIAIGLASMFAVVMILVDRLSPYPADINIAYPASLFFYPAIAYVVEILFHILPFCLIYFSLGFIFGQAHDTTIIWVTILAVALLEPVFQVVLGSGQNSSWVLAYLGLHLFLFNLVQLLLFRRYDFITMYAFRLTYYAIWHILWGHLRLFLLY